VIFLFLKVKLYAILLLALARLILFSNRGSLRRSESKHKEAYCCYIVTATHTIISHCVIFEGLLLLRKAAKQRRELSQKKKKLIRQDATDPEQKAVTDYKDQVDSTPPTPNPSTGKLKSKRTNTTTTDITTRNPISEQRPQEIAHVTYLALI